MPNLYKTKKVKEPVRLEVKLDPEGSEKVILWYHAQQISPALDSLRQTSHNYESFHKILHDWDLTVPKNILEHMEKFEETVKQIQAKVKEAQEPRISVAKSNAILKEIEALKSSIEEEPEPDFDSGEVPIPLREGIVLQLNYEILNTLSHAITMDMFPNLKRAEEFEGSF
jgi:hypothetical protein